MQQNEYYKTHSGNRTARRKQASIGRHGSDVRNGLVEAPADKLSSLPSGRILGSSDKDRIAKAVKKPFELIMQHGLEGMCVYQAAVGMNLLHSLFGIDTVLICGDITRPIGNGLYHTYKNENNKIDACNGNFHAWLYCDATNDIIDFAAWEAPIRHEKAGLVWHGPRPEYLWETPQNLTKMGFVQTVCLDSSDKVINSISNNFSQMSTLTKYVEIANSFYKNPYCKIEIINTGSLNG